MMRSKIRFMSFPLTEPPPDFVHRLIRIFRDHEAEISTEARTKGLTSDEILAVLRNDLRKLGFEIETGKTKEKKIERPVFFGENGDPRVRYEIDAYHPKWKCGLEIEAGRGWMGNAVYRDLIQAAVMVGVEFLCIAVSNTYKYRISRRVVASRDYGNATRLAETIYGHSRFRLPYKLIVIGY